MLCNAVNISPNRSITPHAVKRCEMLWILVQTGHITPTLWMLLNAVNISPNKAYNPHTVKRCEMLWILVQTGQYNPHAVNAIKRSEY